MKSVIGNSLLTFEEMNTLQCQIKAFLNSRPLWPLSEDPDSFSVLTPGQFFIDDVIDPHYSDLTLRRDTF
jgi:hypothetical protein